MPQDWKTLSTTLAHTPASWAGGQLSSSGVSSTVRAARLGRDRATSTRPANTVCPGGGLGPGAGAG